MKRRLYTALLALLALLYAAPAAYAQDQGQGQQENPLDLNDTPTKRGQTGFKFLLMPVDARAAALGNAMTAMETGSIAQFYNPATMAHTQSVVSAALGRTDLFADINYNAASLAFRPGNLGVFGVSLMSVDYGDFERTVRVDNEAGYVNFGTFSPSAYMVGVSYARPLSDRFSVGGNVKYVNQNLGEVALDLVEGAEGNGDPANYQMQDNQRGTMAFDFGALYDTGWRGLNFAMSARNFAQEVTYEQENFELPLTLTIGLAMDVMQLLAQGQDTHSLMLSVDANRPRDYYEALNVGAEYGFMNTVFLRAGYAYPNDVHGINLGAGINTKVSNFGFGADYSYSNWGILGNVNRFSLQFGF